VRIAVIADVHGNRWALEAVLEDIERRNIASTLDLGDTVYGPLDPAGTAELMIRRGIPSVSGNEDRIVVAAPGEGDPPTLRLTRGALAPEHLGWLATFPRTRVASGEVFCCHGTPARDDEYLLEAVTGRGAEARGAAEIAGRVTTVGQPVVVCGHSHVPRVVRLADGRTIVNPGSVGLQAYTDAKPHPHAMAAGSPHARYAVLERTGSGWAVEQVAVAYDWERAAATAARNGRDDWAAWLRTGRADVAPPRRTA